MPNTCAIHCISHICDISFPEAKELALTHGYTTKGMRVSDALKAIRQIGRTVEWLDGDRWTPDGNTTLFGNDRIIEGRLRLWTVRELRDHLRWKGSFIFCTRNHLLSVINGDWCDSHYKRGTKLVVGGWEVS